jgi:hypothetical protein
MSKKQEHGVVEMFKKLITFCIVLLFLLTFVQTGLLAVAVVPSGYGNGPTTTIPLYKGWCITREDVNVNLFSTDYLVSGNFIVTLWKDLRQKSNSEKKVWLEGIKEKSDCSNYVDFGDVRPADVAYIVLYCYFDNHAKIVTTHQMALLGDNFCWLITAEFKGEYRDTEQGKYHDIDFKMAAEVKKVFDKYANSRQYRALVARQKEALIKQKAEKAKQEAEEKKKWEPIFKKNAEETAKYKADFIFENFGFYIDPNETVNGYKVLGVSNELLKDCPELKGATIIEIDGYLTEKASYDDLKKYLQQCGDGVGLEIKYKTQDGVEGTLNLY